MNKIKIQVISDIHLEFYKSLPKIKPLADYLFLAGDIGTIESKYDSKIKKFLTYCSKNWKKTFYVLGNHEFYQTNKIVGEKKCFEDLVIEYEQICLQFPNVYLLNDSYEEVIPGLNVYGSTLWTGNFNSFHNLSDYLNDYNMIGIKSSFNNSTISLNKDFIDNISNLQTCKLKNYLDNTNLINTKTIIMTHFPPIRQGTSNPKYASQPKFISDYFSWNNIPNDLDCSNIIGWISGHTHWSYDIKINNTRFISNQTGYKDEYIKNETGFEPDKIFELEY